MKKINLIKSPFIFCMFLFMNLNMLSCKSVNEDPDALSEKKEGEKTEVTNVTNEKSSYDIEVFTEGLYVPWSIVFTSPERMLVNERDGKMRIIESGVLKSEPLKVFSDVSSGGEEGLMGLALDPDYINNKLLYLSYAFDNGDELAVKVVRYKDNGDNLSEEKIILNNIPAERYHAGCRLRFGPDGKLYITTGDAGERGIVQDKNNLYGKILRVNSDGTIPEDNPFPGNPVWSIGHRNAQGIDWYPGTDILYSTEHGPSGFDGPGGGDEVNVIVKGGNYGWPEVSHEQSMEGMISPALVFTPAVAPASGMFYDSDSIPEFKNNFFFGCLRGNAIYRVIPDENNPSKVKSFEKLEGIKFGRIRDVTQGPDGAIYFSSSNKDGRGSVKKGDDKIYRILKKN
ncbi:MAG: PQQ-dependent sugar dehydrogenase [Ignavibacteria bacterium]|nr:PQQ-dependent sugar dehydrogenase [Ignavibacteria bacterium]